jgi:NitT/TauT family transport system substrate-binding protein
MKRTNNPAAKASLALLIACMLVLAGCSKQTGTIEPAGNNAAAEGSGNAAAVDPASADKKLTPVTQVLNWSPEAEFGGHYAAQEQGFYKDAGLDMEIMLGGPKVSYMQVVASGQADFGIGQAEDIFLAREQGIPVVAIGTVYQKNLAALAYHKESNIKDFADLNGRTGFLIPGAPYWEYVKKSYKLDKVQERAYDLTQFLADKNSFIVIYVTNQPFSFKEQNLAIDYIPLDDSGYENFSNVLFTTEDMIKKKPEAVKAYVEATFKGWEYYRDNPDQTNEQIHELSPELSLESLKFSQEASMPMIFGGEAETKGVGYMSAERWTKLRDQLKEVGFVKKDEPIENVFTTEFLPGKS